MNNNSLNDISNAFIRLSNKLDNNYDYKLSGKITRIIGLTLEAKGIQASVGACCKIKTDENKFIKAIVVGFSDDKIYLMPTADIKGIHPESEVTKVSDDFTAPVGDGLMGRVVDGAFEPIDGLGPIHYTHNAQLYGKMINPLARASVENILDTGVKAINSFITLGMGQRIGLFAGSGVGKSMLMAMLTKFCSADVIVIGLIGERGREVRDFITKTLDKEALKKSVIVASPADYPPVLRMHGALYATSIAEYFRDKGKNVVLLMDSLTRYAFALREVGLAIGEVPVAKGYPASTFIKISQIIERAGALASGGSITGIYTVLAEADDLNDPIIDCARSILDGHICLSRELANRAHFPAIDVNKSISRTMLSVVDENHIKLNNNFRKLLALYEENKDLISIGAYKKGNDANLDFVVDNIEAFNHFLTQEYYQKFDYNQTIEQLKNLWPTY